MNREFWSNAGERAVKTFAQSVLAVIGTDAAGLWNADWKAILATAGAAAVLSLITSAAGGLRG